MHNPNHKGDSNLQLNDARSMLETHKLLGNTRKVLREQPTAHVRTKELHVYPERTVRLGTQFPHLRSLQPSATDQLMQAGCSGSTKASITQGKMQQC